MRTPGHHTPAAPHGGPHGGPARGLRGLARGLADASPTPSHRRRLARPSRRSPAHVPGAVCADASVRADSGNVNPGHLTWAQSQSESFNEDSPQGGPAAGEQCSQNNSKQPSGSGVVGSRARRKARVHSGWGVGRWQGSWGEWLRAIHQALGLKATEGGDPEPPGCCECPMCQPQAREWT